MDLSGTSVLDNQLIMPTSHCQSYNADSFFCSGVGSPALWLQLLARALRTYGRRMASVTHAFFNLTAVVVHSSVKDGHQPKTTLQHEADITN